MKEPRAKAVAVFSAWLFLAASVAAGPSAPAPAPALTLDRPVLLVIDIQNFYFAGGRIPLVGSCRSEPQGQIRDRSVQGQAASRDPHPASAPGD